MADDAADPITPPEPPTPDPPPVPVAARCEVCDWPLAADRSQGCVPGDCAYRPPDGSPEADRIRRRRAELAARETP